MPAGQAPHAEQSSLIAQTGIPDEIADGFYVRVAAVRANSTKTYEYFAGPGGAPIAREQFPSTRVPDDVLEHTFEVALLKRLFGLLDANGDGQATLCEWQNQISHDLQFADENGDGRITLRELSNARENLGFGVTRDRLVGPPGLEPGTEGL